MTVIVVVGEAVEDTVDEAAGAEDAEVLRFHIQFEVGSPNSKDATTGTAISVDR